MANDLQIKLRHRQIIEDLARRHLPGVEIWAYGSRVNGQSHDGSDLDLVLRGPGLGEIHASQLCGFEEGLQDSTLPFLVEARDWVRLPKRFHDEIQRDYRVLVPAHSPWRDTTLGACASLVRDSVAPAKCGDAPYLGLEHIGQGTLSLLGAGTAKDVESTKTAFRAGDILFGKLRPYFRKVVRPCFDGICSTDIWAVRPQPGVDAGYLFYLLASSPFVRFASQGAEGTRMPRAKWEQVSGFAFRLPPVSEQRAIARILGALDEKIELNRRMAAKLEETLATLFKSWFVDFEPVRAKIEGRNAGLSDPLLSLFPDQLVMSRAREVPKGWSVRSLDEIAHFQNGLALQKYRPLEGEGRLPVLKIAQLRSEMLDDKEYASFNIPSDCVVEDGDVVFSWSGSLMVKVWCGGRAALNQHLFKVTSVNYPEWFILGWLHSHMPEFQSIAADKATTMGHIKRRHLRDALCVMPSEQVLMAADDICAAIQKRCTGAKVESRNLANLRDALLPKLISGEIRISGAEQAMEVDV